MIDTFWVVPWAFVAVDAGGSFVSPLAAHAVTYSDVRRTTPVSVIPSIAAACDVDQIHTVDQLVVDEATRVCDNG